LRRRDPRPEGNPAPSAGPAQETATDLGRVKNPL